MIISGVFIVNSLETKDSEGFETIALCHNQMEDHLETRLYLPPYLRPSRCDIKAGSKVFGFADTTTGIGAALAGIDCDVTFEDKNNYHYTKTLTVDGACDFKDKLDVTKAITSSTGDIKANVGDVVATTVSLKNHKHPITIATFTGAIDPVSHAAEGSVTGGTDAPTP
jgi:hypothetical protein